MDHSDVLLEPSSAHALFLCRDPSDDQNLVARWFQRGLEQGEQILCAADDPALMPGLEQSGDVVEVATKRGQCVLISPEALLPAAALTAVLRAALQQGFSGVRVTVQANEALALLGRDSYLRFHHQLDDACRQPLMSALCRYDIQHQATMSLDDMVEAHPAGFDDAQMRAYRQGDRMAVAGDVDISSAEALTAWLTAATSCCGREVVLDLWQLTFVDVTGCRALVRGTETFRSEAGTVFLRGLTGHTEKVMSMLGFDRLPGVRLS